MTDKEKILSILNKQNPVLGKEFNRDMLYHNHPKDVMVEEKNTIKFYSNIDLEYAKVTFRFDDKGKLTDIILSGGY